MKYDYSRRENRRKSKYFDIELVTIEHPKNLAKLSKAMEQPKHLLNNQPN